MSQSAFDAYENLNKADRQKVNSLVKKLESYYKKNLNENAIEDLLSEVSGELKPCLLFELLHEEKSRLLSLGLKPDKAQLLKRFPNYGGIVEEIIADSTSSGLEIDVEALLANPDSILGFRFGKFELLSLLGKGSFGAVFEARDTTIDRLVALKIPHNQLMIELLGADQFVDEAKNSAALYHRNIVPVFEAGGFQDGGFYVACQLIHGPTLRERLNKPLNNDQAATIIRDLASGVAHAHEHGVIHNDIKPDNVLIDELDVPKLTDFGMSQLTDSQKQSLSGGSIPYVAPERLNRNGEMAPDVRSDIWSLGILLYELIFGERCFRGSDDEIIKNIQDPKFIAKTLSQEWPDENLKSIYKKCVAFKPDGRYESAQLLEDDLTRYLNGQSVSTRRPPVVERLSKWSKRQPIVAALSAMVAISLLAIGIGSALYANWMSQRKAELTLVNSDLSESLDRETKGKQQILRRTYAGDMYEALDIYGDQNYFACLEKLDSVAEFDSEDKLRGIEFDVLRKFAEHGLNQFPSHTAAIGDAALSSDGRLIATVAGNGLAIIQNAENGSLVQRIDTGKMPVEVVVFAMDDKILSTVSHKSYQEWDVETGELVRQKDLKSGAFAGLAITSDNKTIVLSKGKNAFILDYDSLEPKRTIEEEVAIRRVTLSPNDKTLVTSSMDGMLRVYELATGNLIKTLSSHSRIVHDASFSPDGKRMVSASWDSTVCIWNTADWSIVKKIDEFEGILRGCLLYTSPSPRD